jgi:putative beta-lysine N-acetyltransferase
MIDQVDEITTFQGATIQHGPLNRRVYLMKTGDAEVDKLPFDLVAFARERGYTKVFCKVAQPMESAFTQAAYVREAYVPGLFSGDADGVLVSRFLDPDRRQPSDAEGLRSIRRLALRKAESAEDDGVEQLPDGCSARLCAPDDVQDMATLYGSIYASYPFPIHDPCFLRRTMASHVRYVGIWYGDLLVALASAELDRASRSAEMTDFATLPDWRGKGLAGLLLRHAECQARGADIATAYTIARGASPGINIIFARGGYLLGGVLVNNTNIAGRIETMNVWYRPLLGT